MRLIYILMTLALSVTAWGQTPLTAEQQKEIVARLDKTAATMQTMSCRFTQTKKMKLMKREITSEGLMLFRRPNCLRWQYVAPYDYSFILNGDKAHIISDGNANTPDLKKNRMFRQMTDVMMTCITGGSLKSSSYFDVEICRTADGVCAIMHPRKKELKQLYTVVTLYFNKANTLVERVEMQEVGGDITTITLREVKINARIDDKTFAVD